MNSLRNRNGSPLSLEQIQKVAPSAFAGQAHESRSDRYAFIPTSEIIEGMRQHGFLPYFACQSLSRTPGKELFTKHQIRFRAAESNLTKVGDTTVEIALTNSHDGTSRWIEELGAFRLACLNGLVVSEGLVSAIRIRHTGNVLDAVIEGSEQMVKNAPKLIQTITEWKQIILTDREQVILAESALSLRFEDNAPVEAQRLLNVRRYDDKANDLWTVFNRIQENTVRGGLRYQQVQRNPETNEYLGTRNARTREVKGIDQSNRLNRELFALAEKMAELKSK